MTTHAYSQLYLSKTSRTVGTMLHDAVQEFHIDGTDFLQRFIQSGVARQIENGNPKYIAGKSGLELFLEIMEKTTGETCRVDLIECYDRSPAYWVGWALTHYQWYSGRSFRHILDTVPYEEMLGLYGALHEADIQKSYDVLDAHFQNRENRLKTARKYSGLTQDALAKKSGVSVNTIRAYERNSKDFGKAGADIVVKLARAMGCELGELVG